MLTTLGINESDKAIVIFKIVKTNVILEFLYTSTNNNFSVDDKILMNDDNNIDIFISSIEFINNSINNKLDNYVINDDINEVDLDNCFNILESVLLK